MYVEIYMFIINDNGLVLFEIGGGIIILGDFIIIDWSLGLYFLKIEIDFMGGMSYFIEGIS